MPANGSLQSRDVLVREMQRDLARRVPGARLSARPLPCCDGLQLYLLQENYPQEALAYEQAVDLMDDPPYWVFCWASGWVMAQYILTQPEVFTGKAVLDFGSGSGVAGIAAASVGADVSLCDVDAQALEISRCNAELNRLNLKYKASLTDCAAHYDIILAADVLYDRDNFPLLETLRGRCTSLLVADSRIKQWPFTGFEQVLAQSAHTLPDLDEGQDYREVRIYRSV